MTWYQSRQNKYKAKSTEYGGNIYHSKLEAGQAQELDFRIKAKELKKWERQIKFEFWLIKKNKNWVLMDKKPENAMQAIKLTTYILDFIAYRMDEKKEFIEVKGDFLSRLPAWKMKWQLLECLYGDNPKIILRVVK